MIVDMSQAAVNRTAMYHISHHVYRMLDPAVTHCQFFGRIFEEIPPPSQMQRMQREAFDALLPDPETYVRARAHERQEARDTPTVYLDPLYILFADLKSSDTVFVLDLSPVTTPAWHAPNIGRAYSLAYDLICSRKPTIVAISQNTADALYANYGYPQERIHVVPLYIPHHLVDDSDGEAFPSPEPYVLFVGSLELRKNVAGAVASFGLSGLGERGYRCLIAGGSGHGSEEIQRAIRTTRNVFVMGYIDNDELRALYRGATAFIYPSYLEGFGIPLLEAMQFGVPAVASTTGACPEVGGDLVRYVDPDDHVGFARELVRLVDMGEAERRAYAAAAQLWVANQFSVAYFERGLRNALGLGQNER